METREHLLARIGAFCAARGLSERQFGLDAVGDHRFVARLRLGKATLGRIERAEAFMESESGSEGVPPASEDFAEDAA